MDPKIKQHITQYILLQNDLSKTQNLPSYFPFHITNKKANYNKYNTYELMNIAG
jgi:hypothetical protein